MRKRIRRILAVRERFNCLLIALWLWFRSRGRFLIGIRRSESLRGTIPHFVVVIESPERVTLIDYVPNHRKEHPADLRRGSALLFRGHFRVREYRMVSERHHSTLKKFRKTMQDA